MTTASKRNQYGRDDLHLNIYAEDVIVWIDFSNRKFRFLHYSISSKQLLKICIKSAGEEDPMEAVKLLHESIQVLIKYAIFFYLLKFLNVVNFLFLSIGMIIKKINY